MPTYTIPGPGGKIYSIDGPPGATREQVIAAIKRKMDMGETPRAPEKSGFFSSIGEGMSNLLNTKAAAQFATASPEEQNSLRQKFLEGRKGNTQGISLDEVDNLPEFWQWLKQTAGQSLGALVVPAAGAIGTKLAGAPNIAAKSVGYGLMGVQYVIDNLARQGQEQEKDISEGRPARSTSISSAIIGAAAQAGLDAGVMELAFAPMLSKFPVLKTLFEAGETETAAGVKELARAYKAGELKLTNGLLQGALFGSAVEIPQEVAQQLIERWQAGLPLADSDAKKEYYESAVGALALGGVFGGVQEGMVTHGKIGLARDEIQREQDEVATAAAERERLIEEQKEAAKAAAQTQQQQAAAQQATVQQPQTQQTQQATQQQGTTTQVTQQAAPAPVESYFDQAAELVKSLATQSEGKEANSSQWYNALASAFNLDKKQTTALFKLLHDRKVITKDYGRASEGGFKLNKLYEPTITEQREQKIAELNPEIRRVTDLASPEDKAALDTLVGKITPKKNEKGETIRMKGDTYNNLLASLNQLLSKYPATTESAVVEPAATTDTTTQAAAEPAAVEPAAVEPAAAEPAAVEPAVVEPAVVEPAAAEPAAAEPAAAEPAAAEPVVVEPAAAETAPQTDEEKVLAAFKAAGKVNTSIIKEVLGLKQQQATAFMDKLFKAGKVVRQGESNRYQFPKEGAETSTAVSTVVRGRNRNTDTATLVAQTQALLERKQATTSRQATFAAKEDAKDAKTISEKLEKNGPLDIGNGVKLRFTNGGFGVEAVNEAGQAVGSITTENGNDVKNVEVQPDYRKRGIGTALFDRLAQVHKVLGFRKSVLNEEGDKFATSLAFNRIGNENEVSIPERLYPKVTERLRAAYKKKVREYVARYMAQNDGAVPPAYAITNELAIGREDVDAGLASLLEDGVLVHNPASGELSASEAFLKTIRKPPTPQLPSNVIETGTAEKEVAAEPEVEVSEAEAVRSGVLDFLSEKPRSEADFTKEYAAEDMPGVSQALSELLASGEVIRDKNGKYKAAKERVIEDASEYKEPVQQKEKLSRERRLSILEKALALLSNPNIGIYSTKDVRKIGREAYENEYALDAALAEVGRHLSKMRPKQREEVFGPNVNKYNGRTAITEATQALLDGKPVSNYLDYLRRHGSMFEKVMADRISRVFADLTRDGFPVRVVSINDVTDAKRVYGKGWERTNGMASFDENGVTIHLTGNFSDISGFNRMTVLHEFNHAATMVSYHLGKQFPGRNKKEALIAKDMDKLQSHVKAKVLELLKNGKLTADEVHLVTRTNFLQDSQELIAWGMSNPVAQHLLEKIEYGTAERSKKRTAWDGFVALIRALLGFNPKADTALSELLHNYAKLTVSTEVRARPNEAGELVGTPPSFSVSQPAAPAANVNQTTYPAPPIQAGTFEDHLKRLAQQEAVRLEPRKGIRETLRNLFSQNNWEKLVTNFQNERRPLLKLSEYLSAAGVLNVLDRTNDLFGEITRSMAMAENILNETMWRHMVDLDKQIDEMSKATGKTKDVVLAELHLYTMARTEAERRAAFYEMNVPLNNKLDTKLDASIIGSIMVTARDSDGKPIKNAPAVALASVSAPAARLRQIIMAELNKNQNLKSNGYAKTMRKALHELVYRSNMQNVDGSVDGFSPIIGLKGTRLSTDINDRVYDVIGAYSRNQIDEMNTRYRAALADSKTGPILDRMLNEKTGTLVKLQEATIAADQKSNYWSNPVQNRKEFYGWKYYVPLKGRNVNASEATKNALDELNFTGERLGGGFQDLQGEMGGRVTDSENPILQTMVDATKAAIRYGRKGTMDAIGNLVDKDPKTGKQYLAGKKLANIPFEQRNSMVDNKDYGGPDKFFVYRDDGSIDIYQVTDSKMREAIRRTFRDRNRLVELGNSITSAIGHLHTRYNVAFHPYNFVRDALTNAFTMGADFGPTMSAKLIAAVSTRVSQSGMLLRAGKISKLYKDGNIDEIRRMARAGDVFAADAVRFYELGGRVTHLSGTDIREQGERLLRDVRRGNIARSKEFVDDYVDTWADAFELTSRVASFGVIRDYYKSKGVDAKSAETRAVTYAKNLANFEQVGKYGKEAGALFMFFRPAATGAVRAIDSLMPAFQSWESYKKGIPEEILGNPESEEYKRIQKDFLGKKKSAQAMAATLAGAGAFMWTLAYMMAGDDDEGRNRIATDKMALWARNIRLPMSVFGKEYEDSYVQIPWGFGLGAFGAVGAQVAGVAGGYTTMGEAIPNLITIALDSYVPIPVSRIDPTENFSAFAATTFFPSVARPFVEYAMNVDSLGREIYNDRQTRYGDAFTGGRNTPQLWKDLSRWIFNITNGEADVSPDTMLFWANNYMDGVTRIAQSGYGLSQFALTDRDFNVKEDFAPISSFVGRASNYDGEKFANLEQHMRDLNQRIRSLERDPDMLTQYVENNEGEYLAVKRFNRDINGWVKRLRSMRNQIEASDLSPREKETKLKEIYESTNYVKRGMLNNAIDAGVKF